MEKLKNGSGSNRVRLICIIAIVVVLVLLAVFFLLKAKPDSQPDAAASAAAEAAETAVKAPSALSTCPDGISVNGVSFSGLNLEAAEQRLIAMEQEIKKNLSVALSGDNFSRTLHGSDLDLTFNRQDVLRQLSDAMAKGDQAPISDCPLLPTMTDDALDALIADLAAEIHQEATDAAVVMQPDAEDHQFVTYQPETPGRDLDESAVRQQLINVIAEKGGSLTLPVIVTEPAVTLETLQQNMVLRSSAQTSFAKSPYNRQSRVFNITKAVGLVNGTVLQPGEVFSTNETLGNRTYAAGWQPAPAIVQGRDEDQAGGGVCQVSSTLYQAVLKGDLEIVYRRGHSKQLGYVSGGLDATIDSGNIDFKWKNNTNSPIYIFCWVNSEEKTVNFVLYGEPLPPEYDEIQLSSEKVETLKPAGEMRYTVDPTQPAGYSEVVVKRKNGSRWHSYATYYKNGEEVKKEFVDETIYKAFDGETIVGPSPAPTPDQQTPNPAQIPGAEVPGLPGAYYS